MGNQLATDDDAEINNDVPPLWFLAILGSIGVILLRGTNKRQRG